MNHKLPSVELASVLNTVVTKCENKCKNHKLCLDEKNK